MLFWLTWNSWKLGRACKMTANFFSNESMECEKNDQEEEQNRKFLERENCRWRWLPQFVDCWWVQAFENRSMFSRNSPEAINLILMNETVCAVGSWIGGGSKRYLHIVGPVKLPPRNLTNMPYASFAQWPIKLLFHKFQLCQLCAKRHITIYWNPRITHIQSTQNSQKSQKSTIRFAFNRADEGTRSAKITRNPT